MSNHRGPEQSPSKLRNTRLALRPLALPVTLLREHWDNPWGVWAFGSRARREARADSDRALGVLLEGMANRFALWSVSAQLAETLGDPVDLVDLRRANTVLR